MWWESVHSEVRCFGVILDNVMFALVNVGGFGSLGKQPRANLSFSGVTLVKLNGSEHFLV